MTKQPAHLQHLIPMGGITLAGLGVSEAACSLSHLCGVVLRMAFEMLPTILLMAWQASEALAFSHPRLLECLCQFLSIWPLVVSLAKAL